MRNEREKESESRSDEECTRPLGDARFEILTAISREGDDFNENEFQLKKGT